MFSIWTYAFYVVWAWDRKSDNDYSDGNTTNNNDNEIWSPKERKNLKKKLKLKNTKYWTREEAKMHTNTFKNI